MKFDPATLRTTSFWVTATFQAAMVVSILADALPVQWGVILSGVSALSYMVSRTITKYRADFKRGWYTTEFWFAAGSVAIAGVATLQTSFGAEKFATLAAVLATAYKVGRALVTPRTVDLEG